MQQVFNKRSDIMQPMTACRNKYLTSKRCYATDDRTLQQVFNKRSDIMQPMTACRNKYSTNEAMLGDG